MMLPVHGLIKFMMHILVHHPSGAFQACKSAVLPICQTPAPVPLVPVHFAYSRHQQNAQKSALQLDDSVPFGRVGMLFMPTSYRLVGSVGIKSMPTLRFSTRERPIFEEHSEFSGLGA